MCHAQTGRIKSGWKNVFTVFHMAASGSDEQIVEMAFTTVQEVVCMFTFALYSVIKYLQCAI